MRTATGPITRQQKTLFYTLISNNGLREMKDDLVLQYSEGRTSHVSELSQSEFQALIKTLQSSDPTVRMRRKLFAIAYSLGWLVKDADEAERKVNTAALNLFFKHKGVVKKEVGKMNRAELARAISQLEKIREKDVLNDLNSILSEAGIEIPK